MAASVTRRGQVTIPKHVRERLAIVTGSAVAFGLAPDGRVVITKVGGWKPKTLNGASEADPREQAR